MNSVSGKLTALLLALFFVMYAAIQTVRFFYTGYKTENAYSFEVARVYSTSGLLVRDEHPIHQTYSGELLYTIPEGGKIIPTTPVAVAYADAPAAQRAANYQVLDAEQRLLYEIARQPVTSVKNDIDALSDDINDSLRLMTAQTNVGKVSNLSHTRLRLVNDICRRQVAVGNKISFDARLDKLQEEMGQPAVGTVMNGGATGYFSRYVDGCEEQFTPAILETLDIAQLEELLKKDYPSQANSFGKCIVDYNWYYVTTVPLEEIALFQPGVRMTLSFAGSDGKQVGGWVKSVTEDKPRGKALLVIQSDDVSADTVARRTATVKLGFDNYSGIRFSKRALRIQNGVKGVFVRGKSAIEFKKVEIVYSGKDFYLSRLDYNSKVYLNIFDEIIVEGANLYDGKTLE